jgi:hypothetical protein
MDEIRRACSEHGEKRNACRFSVGKPEGKRPLGKDRRMWESDIKIHLRERGWAVWTGVRIGIRVGLLLTR